jgi:hypothetical protein
VRIFDFVRTSSRSHRQRQTVRTFFGIANSRGRTVIPGAAPLPTYKTENRIRECIGLFPVDPPPMVKLAAF